MQSADEELNNPLAIVDAIQAVTMELRETRRKLSRQITRILSLVDYRMLEARDFKELKNHIGHRRRGTLDQDR